MVAYIFPPLGGGGVFRTLKLVRYLPEQGWRPTVLTSRDGGGPPRDESLLEQVPAGLRVERVTDPLGRLRPGGRSGSGSPDRRGSLPRRMVSRIRRSLPGEQPAWAFRAWRRGAEIVRRGGFDLVYSTSSPPEDHLIARRLARAAGIPWVAEFRDPWTWNYVYHKPWPVKLLERRLEAGVVRSADAVVTVSEPVGAAYRRLLSPADREKVVTIPSGYDPADIIRMESGADWKERIEVVFCGNFDRRQRPTRFLEALRRLLARRPELGRRLRVRFLGNFLSGDRALIAEWGLAEVVTVEGYRPYRECQRALAGADILLFIVYSGLGAETIVPGKTYQYLALGKPILAIAPEGEARKLLDRSGLARICEPDDIESIAAALGGLIDDHDRGGEPRPDEALIESFAWPVLAGRLAELFERVLRGRS